MIHRTRAARTALVLAVATLSGCDLLTGPRDGSEDARVARALAVGQNHSCAVGKDGVAYCWGSNTAGQLGTGTAENSDLPRLVAGGLRFTAISASWNTTCALTPEKAAYCWGAGEAGQVGNGQRVQANPLPARVVGGHRFAQISVAPYHTCALDESGAAYCWGSNNNGRLANTTLNSSAEPLRVPGNRRFRSISAGLAHTCGLTLEGEAYCWGGNMFMQIDGSRTEQSIYAPERVLPGTRFTELEAGSTITCGISGAGTLCWGSDNYGTRGTGVTSTEVRTPSTVVGGVRFNTLSLSSENSIMGPMCGLTSAGLAYCWGANRTSQLGTGDPMDGCTFGTTTIDCTGTPVPVHGGTHWAAVMPGANHGCGITPDRDVLCWGDNSFGQVGSRDVFGNRQWSPVRVGLPPGFR